jgi:hypothetical protein
MTSPIGPLRPRGRSHADRFRRKKPAELSDFPPVSAVGVGQVRELLDILTGLASFEGRASRLTIVSYS